MWMNIQILPGNPAATHDHNVLELSKFLLQFYLLQLKGNWIPSIVNLAYKLINNVYMLRVYIRPFPLYKILG